MSFSSNLNFALNSFILNFILLILLYYKFLSLPLSLLPGPIPAADRWTSQHERAHSTFGHCFFRSPFFHFLLLSPKINRTTGWMLNSCSTIYNRLLLLRPTAQGFFSSQAVIKTSLLKTINIFVNSFVLPFNITRGNRTQQSQLPFLYKW